MSRKTTHILLLATAAALMPGAVSAQDGFSISIGADTVAGDATLAAVLPPRAPAVSSDAEVFVTVDGLGVRPRLDLGVTRLGADRVRLTSSLNYPDFVTSGEVRLVDLDATGGPAVLEVLTLAPGGSIEVVARDGQRLAAIHRVYDAAGRFDETRAIPISEDRTPDAETGDDTMARRAIPVRGGAVSVVGRDLAPGAQVAAFGSRYSPDPSGALRVQRILPVGTRSLPVRVTGAGRAIALEPVVSIPRSEWFGVGRTEATLGLTLSGPDRGRPWTRGQAAFYTNAFTASGWEITASADTGEGRLDEIIRDFERKDPTGVIARLDPELAYPTFGDDSEIVNDAPTDGKLYLRAERGGSYAMWGNAKAPIAGTEYLRNERMLYGASGVYQSPDRTGRGAPRVTVQAYAAQPDRLPARDIFRGTGGSVYFLRYQDIGLGSEVVTIQTRDPVTGRVLDRRTLSAGTDYAINAYQGTVTLARPLASMAPSGALRAAPGDRPVSELVVQYEFTPTATTVSGYSYGGRIEAWASDDLRLGVTGMVEQTGIADQTAVGADLRLLMGEGSYVEAEIARSSGPGFAAATSLDGGVIFGTGSTTAGTGTAYRLDAHLAFADFALPGEGAFDLWAEQRGAGFSTLDYAVTDAERFAGGELTAKPSETLEYRLRAEAYESASGLAYRQAEAEISLATGPRLTWDLALAVDDRTDPTDPTETGLRADVAAKVTFSVNDALDLYTFGQYTVKRTGARARNDRIGAGVAYGFAQGWLFEGEVSTGTLGLGGLARLSYEQDGNSAYLGYELDPGRDFGPVALIGRDAGRLTAGGRVSVSDNLALFTENSYDLFGDHRDFGASYGVDVTLDGGWNITGAYEIGRIDDPLGDFDRDAISVGLGYDDGAGNGFSGRFEYRRDTGFVAGVPTDTDAIAALFAGNYAFSESSRMVGSLELAHTTTTAASLPSGDYGRASVGYAFRPVDDDRLNLFARYTFLYDMYGQSVDGTTLPGPVQKSHVFSLDGTWQIDPVWEVGAKVGVRLGESAPDSSMPLVRNDAGLAVANLRYHMMNEWDALIEGRHLYAPQAGLSEAGFLASINRQLNETMSIGVGYNFGQFSDDLTDLTADDHGIFLNVMHHF